MDFKIDTTSPVMVTGATGYVAGQLVRQLLDAGVTVHATVRDPSDAQKLKYLAEVAEGAAGELKYFKADLLTEGSYDQAATGCSIVFHTASPFTVDVEDPQRDLVDPAKLGTRNVLEAVNRSESVRRVVLTSSCAAIYGDCTDCRNAPGGILNEDIWNTSSSLDHQAYSFSKTEAEKEAWSINKLQSRWDLVVINPSLVIGPGINPHATSESFAIVRQMGDGTMRTGCPRFGMGAVDVREVAYAHLAAAFLPDAKGRHIVSGHNTDLYEMAKTLRPTFGKRFPLPPFAALKPLVWLVGPLINRSLNRKVIALNVNVPWKADNSKSIRELGVNYRPLNESMTEMFQQMVDNGAFAG